MAIATDNDLVSSTCIVKILYQAFLRYVLFSRNVFCIWMRKKNRTLLFLCELSHTNSAIIVSGLDARYNLFGVNAHK